MVGIGVGGECRRSGEEEETEKVFFNIYEVIT
jgi:hypothetical protein